MTLAVLSVAYPLAPVGSDNPVAAAGFSCGAVGDA